MCEWVAENILIFKMKTLIAILILGASYPVNAYENIGDRSNREVYASQRGYAYEKKCFRYEYREKYIPGNSMSPGYVLIVLPLVMMQEDVDHIMIPL